MKQYIFEIKKAISGVGETEEEAWKDACQNEGVHESVGSPVNRGVFVCHFGSHRSKMRHQP